TRFTVLTGEVLVRQLQGGQPFGGGVTLRSSDQARLTGLTPPVTRRLSPSEASQLSNSFKATKTDPPAAVNAPLVTQSQALATQTVTTGVPNPDPAPVSRTVTNVIQYSNNKGSLDKRQDLTVQQATVLTPNSDVFRQTSIDNQAQALVNNLPDSVKSDLKKTLQQSSPGGISTNSGPGSSSGSSSGSGGAVTTVSVNGQTVPVSIGDDGALKVDRRGRNRGKH